jgi:putative alpha-1,2-mannosidase
MGESAQVAVSAGSGDVMTAFEDRGLPYSHSDEVTKPQYYKTVLNAKDSSKIVAELSSTSRASTMRFSFAAESNPYVAVHITTDSISGEVNIDPSRREITGWNPERQDSVLGPTKAEDFKGYFVVVFDQDFSSFGTANGAAQNAGAVSGEGTELSAYVRFNSDVKVVNARVGVSFISIDQARINLETELPSGQTLEATADIVEKQWAEKLDRVAITNATEDQSVIFYTAMYHGLQVFGTVIIYSR